MNQLNQPADQNQIPDHLQSLIQEFLIAPEASKQFLLREMGIALMQNILCTVIFVYLFYTYGLSLFSCSITLTFWFMIFTALNMQAIYCKLTFLPGLFLIKNPRSNNRQEKFIFLRRLKSILNTKIYHSNTRISQILITTYFFGVIFLFVSFTYSLVFSETCYDEYPIRKSMGGLILIFFIKFYFTTRNHRRLDKQKREKSQNEFLVQTIYENSENNKTTQCPICLADFEDNELVAEFQCAGLHQYHYDCIKEWLDQKTNQTQNCPYCRQLPPEYM